LLDEFGSGRDNSPHRRPQGRPDALDDGLTLTD